MQILRRDILSSLVGCAPFPCENMAAIHIYKHQEHLCGASDGRVCGLKNGKRFVHFTWYVIFQRQEERSLYEEIKRQVFGSLYLQVLSHSRCGSPWGLIGSCQKAPAPPQSAHAATSKQRHIIISLIFLSLRAAVFSDESGDLGKINMPTSSGACAFSNEAITQGHAGHQATQFNFCTQKRAQITQSEIWRSV